MAALIALASTRVEFSVKRSARAICVLLLMSWLSACIDPTVSVRRTGGNDTRIGAVQTSAPLADQHRVEKGDTLYGIAFRYQLDVRQLVQINQIYEPYIIYPGQMLRLKPENAASLPAEIRSVPAPRYVGNSGGAATVTAINAAPISNAGSPSQGANTAASVTLPPTVVPASEGFVSVDPSAGTAGLAPSSQAITASNANPTALVAAAPSAAAAPAITTPTIVAIPNPVLAAPILSSVSGAPKPGANGWAWPTEGRLLSTFAAADAGRQGIDIRGNLGQPVYAARGGTVVYSGRGIRGYGELIVIKHDENTLSAYGHNQTRTAIEGQVVKQGALIAEMGKDPQGRELLHFEVRKNGKPVDPLGVLPRK